MRLDQLRYFVKVVECRSFNKAAKELYVTQPTLTASMQSLEKELGVTLLRRSSKGTHPTEFGMRVYQDCKDLLLALEEKTDSWREFSRKDGNPSGTVRLAAIPIACNFIMEDIVWGIGERYPEIDISLQEIGMFGFVREMFLAGITVGLTCVSSDEKEQAAKLCRDCHFSYEVLTEDEYDVYMNVKHPFASKDSLTKEDCESMDFITYSVAGHDSGRDFFSARFFPANGIRQLNSFGNIMESIADNQGCGVFLRKMMGNNWFLKNGIVCSKPIAGERLLPSEHWLIWANDGSLTAADEAVVDYIRENYSCLCDGVCN